MRDIVFDICEQMLKNSPQRSFKRLNPSLRSTLVNCITADLPFRPDTFKRIYFDLRGHYWFGDGAGSHAGEHFYSTACECNHTSGQESFEHFADRPKVLWEESAKTPTVLHVGARFTWKGEFLTVTSMRKTSLVACSYKGYEGQHTENLAPGARFGYGPEYLVVSSAPAGDATMLTVVKASHSEGNRDVLHRLTVTYHEIAELRRTSKLRVKAVIQKIAACDPDSDAEALQREVGAGHFRHWELEQMNAALQARRETVEKNITSEQLARRQLDRDEIKLAAWRGGAGGAWLGVDGTFIRIRGDRVDCSNGNSIARATAEAILPIVMANRNKSINLAVPIDSYRIDRVGPDGVKVGCTLIPWQEIERIAPELAA